MQTETFMKPKSSYSGEIRGGFKNLSNSRAGEESGGEGRGEQKLISILYF